MIKIKKDKDGATIEVSDKKGYKEDFWINLEELDKLYSLLKKLLKKV